MSKMWIGSRVRVTQEWDGIPVGTEGVHLGETQGLPGSLTIMVGLDDGRTVRLPVLSLARVGAWDDRQGASEISMWLEIAKYDGDTKPLVEQRMRDYLTLFPDVTFEVEAINLSKGDGTHRVSFVGPAVQVALLIAQYAGADRSALELAAALLRQHALRK
jgi:hypothetical protein